MDFVVGAEIYKHLERCRTVSTTSRTDQFRVITGIGQGLPWTPRALPILVALIGVALLFDF